MSTEINDGGPAFPHFKFAENGKVEILPQGGMTLRDYFAAQALAGMLTRKESDGWTNREVAGDCYSYADAMLAAREVSK
jgi:hypothetical protein